MDIKAAQKLACKWDIRNNQQEKPVAKDINLRERVHDLGLAFLCLAHVFSDVWRKAGCELLWRAFSAKKYSHVSLASNSARAQIKEAVRGFSGRANGPSLSLSQEKDMSREKNSTFVRFMKKDIQDVDAIVKSRALMSALLTPFKPKWDRREGLLIEFKDPLILLLDELSLDLPLEEFQKQSYLHLMKSSFSQCFFQGELLKNGKKEDAQIFDMLVNIAAASFCLIYEIDENQRDKTLVSLKAFIHMNQGLFLAQFEADPEGFYTLFSQNFKKAESDIEKKRQSEKEERKKERESCLDLISSYKKNHVLKFSQDAFLEETSSSVNFCSCLRWVSASLSNPENGGTSLYTKIGGESKLFTSEDSFEKDRFEIKSCFDFVEENPSLISFSTKRQDKKNSLNAGLLKKYGLVAQKTEPLHLKSYAASHAFFQSIREISSSFMLSMGGGGATHFAVFERKANTWYFYDPHFGIFEFDALYGLQQFLTDFIQVAYPKAILFTCTSYVKENLEKQD